MDKEAFVHLKKPSRCFKGWFLVGVFFLLLASSAGAEKAAVVISRTAAPYQVALKGFKATLEWDVKTWNMEGDREKGRQLMQSLTAQDADVVVALGGEASQAADYLSKEIPLVYTMILNAPKVTERKTSSVILEIGVAEQLARVKKMFPTRNRIGVIYNSRYSYQAIKEAREFSNKHDLVLFPIGVNKQGEVPNALLKMNNNTVDIIWMVIDKTVAHPQSVRHMIIHSRKEHIPLIGLSKYHVKAGALAAFSVDLHDVGVQTAMLVKNVHKKNQQYHEQPRKIIIYVNPKVQKQMGINDLSVFSEVKFIQ